MMEEFVRSLLSNLVNESICNQEYWVQLPCEQKKVLDEMLAEIHDLVTSMDKIDSNGRKVLPQYQAQVRDAMIIKLATELGMINRGKTL